MRRAALFLFASRGFWADAAGEMEGCAGQSVDILIICFQIRDESGCAGSADPAQCGGTRLREFG